MSDPNKFAFDSIPLDGGNTAVADPPRPSFSRSVPDMSSAGLLPPTRKPVAVTLPDPTPLIAAPAAEPNPMASTPPPKAGSARGFLWDLVRPTRTKWAVLAGGVSLLAGAYGLNLFVPTPGEAPKTSLPETAKLTGPSPQVVDERQRPPSVDEQRTVAALPPKETAPAPLAPLPAPAPSPFLQVKHEEPAPAPLPSPVPLKPDDKLTPVTPLPAPPLDDKKPAPIPVPVFSEKNDPVKPVPLPPINPEQPGTTSLPAPTIVPDKPVEVAPLPKPAMSATLEPKPAEGPAPLPKPGFVETPDPTMRPAPLPVPGAIKPDPIPAPGGLPDIKMTPVGDNKPLPEVKMSPVGDSKPIPLPPIGGTADTPKPVDPVPAPKPVDPIPMPVKPLPVDPKPLDVVPTPPVVPVAEKKLDPVPAPLFKEEKPAVGAIPVVGAKEPPVAAPSATTPPKKGFEVDVVKVRPTDTYTSISEAFYQSRKYAAALRVFNGDVDISRLQEVEVPPLFELQKQVGIPAREAEPIGGGARAIIPARNTAPTEPAVRGPVLDPSGDAGESADWGPAGKKRPVIKYERFTTPKDGMTLRDVAKAVYADENEWPKLIGPRGAKLRADDRLPRGTELTVPREELPWK